MTTPSGKACKRCECQLRPGVVTVTVLGSELCSTCHGLLELATVEFRRRWLSGALLPAPPTEQEVDRDYYFALAAICAALLFVGACLWWVIGWLEDA